MKNIGANCVKDMIIEMHEINQECIEEVKQHTIMKLFEEDTYHFENVTCCSICEECEPRVA